MTFDGRLIGVWSGVLLLAVGCVAPYEGARPVEPTGWTAPAYRPPSPAPSAPPAYQGFQDHVTWETDQFNGVDKRTVDLVLEDVALGDTKLFSVSGLIQRASGQAHIRIQVHNMRGVRFGGWRYLDCHPLALLVDAQPFPLTDAEYRNSMTRRVLGEVLFVDDRRDLLAALGRAGRVQGRVCSDVFELRPAQIRLLHDFLQRLEPEMAALGLGWGPQPSPPDQRAARVPTPGPGAPPATPQPPATPNGVAASDSAPPANPEGGGASGGIEEFLRPDAVQRDAVPGSGSAPADDQDGHIGETRNEFSGLRSLFLLYDDYDDGVAHLFIISAGQRGAGRYFYFRFDDPSSRPPGYYFGCHNFYFLVNGRRMAARMVLPNTGTTGVEGVTAAFDRSDLGLLAGARDARFQGCLDANLEYAFDAGQLPRLKEWARRAARFR